MDNAKEHQEVMVTLGIHGERLAQIVDHLKELNHKTAKNEEAIDSLREQDRHLTNLITAQTKQEKEISERQERREVREESWRNRWIDLLFGNLNWLLPAIIIGILWYGREIIEFINIGK